MQSTTVFKFAPNIPAAISHLLLLFIAIWLFMGRKMLSLRPSFILETWPDFYLHVSNFSISYILLSSIGFLWVLMGMPRKFILMLGLLIAGVNVVYECWIPVLNTPDMVDAYYGLWGTASALCFLLLLQRYGTLAVTKATPDN